MTDRFITVNAVAKLLGLHHLTARQWLDTMGLPTVTIGKRHVYRRKDVMSRIDQLLGNP